MTKSEVTKFVKSQKSLHLYKEIQNAFVEVLGKLSEDEYHKATTNLIVMAFQEGVSGQVMHFSPMTKKFTVMQLTIPNKIPDNCMGWIIAHELGHVMQGRNWKNTDGSKLEDNANEWAQKWGFPLSPSVSKWLHTDRLVKDVYGSRI